MPTGFGFVSNAHTFIIAPETHPERLGTYTNNHIPGTHQGCDYSILKVNGFAYGTIVNVTFQGGFHPQSLNGLFPTYTGGKPAFPDGTATLSFSAAGPPYSVTVVAEEDASPTGFCENSLTQNPDSNFFTKN